MPFGSRACFTTRWSLRASLETACGHQRFLARPMPCSPVMAPPTPITQRNNSSSAASARRLAPGWCNPPSRWCGCCRRRRGRNRRRAAVFLLQARGELETVLQPAARHDDVFVQLGQAGVAERIGKFAADFPDFFALGGAQAAFDKQRLLPADDFFQVAESRAGRIFSGRPVRQSNGRGNRGGVRFRCVCRRRPA